MTDWPKDAESVNGSRVWPIKTPDPEWFKFVVAGSVLREGPSGPFRVVRKLSRRRDGRLSTVSLVIRRPSWTGRAYTVLNASDLKCRKFQMVYGVRVKPKTLLDVRIQQSIAQRGGRPYIITAREVRGIP